MPSSLFLYVHIPYCKQKCSYCNFITFEEGKTLPSKDYVSILKKEIQSQSFFFKDFQVETLYFGGGTPSLIPTQELGEVITESKKYFSFVSQPEITIEINPGTLDQKKLTEYESYGVNRFSLGVQTFTPWFLKKSGRLHTAEDSIKDLELLKKNNFNFSVDLMFGFPHQTLSSLKEDLKKTLSFNPPHLSLYNLTIPKNHELSLNRPEEHIQIKMFRLIEEALKKGSLYKYEISNFAQKGRKSKHNLAYWNEKPVLGFGVSAHSYLPPDFMKNTPYGTRFWNAYHLKHYISQNKKTEKKSPIENLPVKQIERLKAHEALTDFCHTRLRKSEGFSLLELKNSFPPSLFNQAVKKLSLLEKRNWLKETSGFIYLTSEGEILSNQVFLELTFFEKDFNLERDLQMDRI